MKRKVEVFYTVISVLVIVLLCAACTVFHVAAAAAVLLCGALLLFLWWIVQAARCRHMRNMIEEIDEILHGAENIRLSDYREGELSLLKNEISKMTVMLKSQTNQLKQEKVKLADSLADISHQIRTPLTSLNLLLAGLKREETDSEKRRETLFEMSRQLERIDRLVTCLLKIAKIDAGTIALKKEEIEFERLVDNALNPLEILLELKAIRVEKNVSGRYIGDLLWSTEALENILKNCIEHTNEGGQISISGRENNVYSELTVEDNGKGIAKEDMPHIFERFYKGEDSAAGSYGIGLALAKMIIAGQNGTIKAENREPDRQGAGARFIIRFYKSIV